MTKDIKLPVEIKATENLVEIQDKTCDLLLELMAKSNNVEEIKIYVDAYIHSCMLMDEIIDNCWR